MEINKMLSLSTAHITKETESKLSEQSIYEVNVYEKSEYGYFIYPNIELLDKRGWDIPEDLKKCIGLAKANNCNWIVFDRDVDPVDELPTYEW
ncbi:hypothetical protein bpr_II108 (plasmid) [Butyrivibrio proteoclasticus B316]|uniref:DUF5983 domain-containing protein n=2 Tax=Butyrivibrio proteoclasticus TaxID=43305 RepID=E0S3R5_BUTPB|nr:hypothetical protein bpr_II108 [Butyrivibrio proteoclasticus B316]